MFKEKPSWCKKRTNEGQKQVKLWILVKRSAYMHVLHIKKNTAFTKCIFVDVCFQHFVSLLLKERKQHSNQRRICHMVGACFNLKIATISLP